MKFQYRIGTAVASTALVMNMLAPAAFADTYVEIWGNGSKSDNTADVNNSSNTTVNQTNNSTVTLNVTAKAKTGGNKASGNTGGDTEIDTGNANATANVTVAGGVNAANLTSCGCEDETTTVKVTNNGKKTDNNATVNTSKKKTANQTANSSVSGNVKAKAKTGKNKAKDNTNGSVNVTTGGADSATNVEVVNPVNVLDL